MGALGNGRRGGRSPPLMIGALIACILVLGFNYWVSSSRSLELQTKLYELEGQVRRGAAERGSVELKKKEFQEENVRQKEQISRIENLYKRQLEGSQNTCSQEKGTLQLNITSSTRTIQELKSQLNMLNEDLVKVQKDCQTCEGSLNSVNKKFTYELTQCNTQILAQREECSEKVAAAKLEVQKKLEKKTASSSQVKLPPTQKVDVIDKEEGLGKAGQDDTKTTPVHGHTPEPPRVQSEAVELKASELETNEIAVDNGLEAPASLMDLKLESLPSAVAKGDQTSPVGGAGGGEETPGKKKNLTEDDVEVMDTHGEDTQLEDAVPGTADILIGQVDEKGEGEEEEEAGQKRDEEFVIGQKVDGPDDYDADEQIVGGVDPAKPNQIPENIDKDMEEELADYNGDDDNEGEFEADKQAELAQI